MRIIIDTIFGVATGLFIIWAAGTNLPKVDVDEILRKEHGYTTEQTEQTTQETTEEATEAVTIPLPAQRLWTDEERELVALTVYLEARGSGVEGMALVANVIVNRMNKYNATATDVIYAPKQFAVVGTDGWNTGYYSPEAMQAVELVEAGWDASQGACYFCTPAHNAWHSRALTYLFTYKGTEYYK